MTEPCDVEFGVRDVCYGGMVGGAAVETVI